MASIPFDFLIDIWNIFLLVLVRITGMFYLSPIFGRRNLPNYFKVGFSFFLAVAVANSATVPDLSGYKSLTSFVVLIGKELLIGLMLGFISYMIFSAIHIAGQLIDLRIGFGMVSVLDPVSNVQIPISADFYVVLATLYMLITDSHHLLINAIAESYTVLPIAEATFSGTLLKQVVELFTDVFILGFKIAAPITATILITDLALGIISKSMPQLNVFMLGMPVKIMLGLGIILVTLTAFKGIVNVIIQGTYEEIYKFLELARSQ